MVRIGIIGYGKMGQLIEKIALDKGHMVNAIIDPIKNTIISEESLKEVYEIMDMLLGKKRAKDRKTWIESNGNIKEIE